jgi:hypothetical protein
VPQTTTPRERAASRSIDAFAIPVVTSSRSASRRSNRARVNGVRSRIATTTSKPSSRATSASSSATCSRNDSTDASSDPQSASDRAMP